MIWPDSKDSQLEIELAQVIRKSELLVSEDEEFINNFILSEEAIQQYKQECEESGSIMRDVLIFSGSLAAVAGAVFFFSDRTRVAVTAAAVLPSALATVSSLRIGTRVGHSREAEEFRNMVKKMLEDMQQFKVVLRKSLNLIQGMEMMNNGYMQMNGKNNETEAGTNSGEESELSKALCRRSSFIPLRRAMYSQTVQIITVYRYAFGSTIFKGTIYIKQIFRITLYNIFIEILPSSAKPKLQLN